MIKIRIHKRIDIPFRVKWLNNPLANKFTGENIGETTTLKKQKEWFDNYQKNKNKKFFIIADDDYRGRGVGKIAMDWLLDYGFYKLKLHKINLGVIADNVPAVKLYKKLGFKIEGTMIDEVRHKNKYYNFYSMALFEKNYKKRIKV